jgi:hypothetical protein
VLLEKRRKEREKREGVPGTERHIPPPFPSKEEQAQKERVQLLITAALSPLQKMLTPPPLTLEAAEK